MRQSSQSIYSKLFHYLNPLSHLGETNYSLSLPYIIMLPITVVIELYANLIIQNPAAVSDIAIVLYVGFIIYFSFRSGIRGGISAVILTIAYYSYIILSRNYTGDVLRNSLATTIALGLIYLMIAFVIGWLRQKIDSLLQRETSAKLRLLEIIRQLPVGIIIADNRGQIIELNYRVQEIFGKQITPGHHILEPASLLISPKTGQHINPQLSPLNIALTQGKTVKNKEYILTGRQAKPITLRITAAPVLIKEGKITAVVGIYQNVTHLRELERRKDDFINLASHELKTPITSFSIYLSILRKALSDKQYSRAEITIDKINTQINNLQSLTHNLLDVSQIQAGKIRYKREEFRLDSLIHEILDNLPPTPTQQRIRPLRLSPIKVNADRDRISQVIVNLINNAVKFSQENSDINISLQKKDHQATFSIQDYGIGIDKSQIGKIFDKMYQVNEGAANTYPGFGIGLHICRDIIHRHKGKIWATSQKGQGSTFYFSLPI